MDNPATRFTGARTNIDDPVSGFHRFFIMLDNNQRIAKVAKTLQGIDELAIVTLVQTDRRFVEHIQDANQTGANLRG